MFLDDSVSIHGVLAPFTSLDPNETQSGCDFLQSPPCDFLNPTRPVYTDMWVRVIRVLSSNGFVSFAVGLNSVLDKILEDYPNLDLVTVFAPPDFQFVGASDPFLDRIVRYHVVQGMYNFTDLVSLPEKDCLMTLLKEEELEISSGSINDTRVLAINGVEVTLPDVYSTEMFVVHGISRALDFSDPANN